MRKSVVTLSVLLTAVALFGCQDERQAAVENRAVQRDGRDVESDGFATAPEASKSSDSRHASRHDASDDGGAESRPATDPTEPNRAGRLTAGSIDDHERLAELAGATREISRSRLAGESTIYRHGLLADQRFGGPDQNRFTSFCGTRYGVQTEIHAVDEVDIGYSPGEIQRFVPGRSSSLPGVTGTIGSAEIGLGLDDTGNQTLPAQVTHQVST